MNLGVNIDHVAILREARQVNDPDILEALFCAAKAKADQITIHLREDRRHIHDEDLTNIIALSPLPVNVECAINELVIDFVLPQKPSRITLVPEKREELTTEGGLDIKKHFSRIKKIISLAKIQGVEVSLFIDPNIQNIKLAKELEVEYIELHTGEFANLYLSLHSNILKTRFAISSMQKSPQELKKSLKKSIKDIKQCAKLAKSYGIKVAAGHGLNYQNVKHISKIKSISELNIGQSIIARSVFVGLKKAICQMKELL